MPPIWWPSASKQVLGLGAHSLVALLFAWLIHGCGCSLEIVAWGLALLWALPLAWYLAFHGRLRFDHDHVYLRSPGALVERCVSIQKKGRICIDATPTYGTVMWSVVHQARKGAREVICPKTPYDEARRVAKAISRATGCPMESPARPGETGRRLLPSHQVDLLYLEKCEACEALPPPPHQSCPEGIQTSSTREGGSVYSWKRLPLGQILTEIGAEGPASILFFLVGLAAFVLWEGLSVGIVLSVVGVLVVMAVGLQLFTAQLVVSRDFVRHRLVMAGLPICSRKVATQEVEDMGALDDVLVISDRHRSLLFRSSDPDDTRDRSSQWLLDEVARIVRVAQENARLLR